MGIFIRHHRRQSGLTQRELAEILGTISDRQVARHENFSAIPSFLAAIGYLIVFRASIAELFPGFYDTVRQNVELRLDEMERLLQESTAKGREADDIAHKLKWFEKRRNRTMP